MFALIDTRLGQNLWHNLGLLSRARVVKLVDAGDSKSPAARRAGSIPAPGTSDFLQIASTPPFLLDTRETSRLFLVSSMGLSLTLTAPRPLQRLSFTNPCRFLLVHRFVQAWPQTKASQHKLGHNTKILVSISDSQDPFQAIITL